MHSLCTWYGVCCCVCSCAGRVWLHHRLCCGHRVMALPFFVGLCLLYVCEFPSCGTHTPTGQFLAFLLDFPRTPAY